MGITPDGFFTWAIKDPGPADKTNAGKNSMDGVVIHSAEGRWPYLRDLLWSPAKRGSWMASNLKDGRFFQHYSVFARTWTSDAGFPNNSFNAWENEGVEGEPLTAAQNDNNIRAIRELSELGDWEPRRPSAAGDFGATLWEHNEMVRFGAEPTACPSGRIPWQLYLDALNEEDDDMKPFLCWASDTKKVFLVGPFGAAWITKQEDVTTLEGLYGKMSVALTEASLASIDR